MEHFLARFQPSVQVAILLILAILAGLLLYFLFWRVVKTVAGRTATVFDDSLVKHCRRPSIYIFPLLLLHFIMPLFAPHLSEGSNMLLGRSVTILLILTVARLLIRLGRVLEDLILQHCHVDVADNLRARGIHTQVQIIRKIINLLVIVLAVGVILMSFDNVRQLGAGLLASAGLAGLVIGFAAQRTLSNLLAGIQIAITQPIRLDDVVVEENEWGRIEEITLTYVVVRIWDMRRLVLPISHFLEKPFQNWTRSSSEILGTVFLYMDYTVPVDAVRAELHRILEESDKWDGKVESIQVTDATAQTIEIRALVSAADSSKAWNLRCHVREKLINFLQKNYPRSLPRIRPEGVELAVVQPTQE